MTTMVRKRFFITDAQNKRLKEHAAATGASEADLMRAGIDLYLNRLAEEQRAWQKNVDETLGELSGAWAGRDDIEELLRKNRQGWKRRLKRLGSP